jgi:response regulator NasT
MTRTLRIAVADDEPDVLDYFQRMLPLLGHQVVAAASDGRALVELCRELMPDLIIADVRMPVMDGDVAVEQICRNQPTPFILISAYSKPLEDAGEVGSTRRAYLTKPVRRKNLVEAIEQVCPEKSGHELESE